MISSLPDPVWPSLLLASIQFVDGLLSKRPVAFVAKCFEDVGFPRRWWWLAPPIKFAAATGLIVGIWVPWLGLITGVALVVYFLIAIGLHVRARDFGRNLFVNATGMLLICLAVLAYSFL